MTDPDTLPGNTKVTRQDWLDAAQAILVSDGVERVKVLTLAQRLDVSRSSFYWYFQSRKELLTALLDHWIATNTKALVSHSHADQPTITAAICNVFICFIDEARFNNRLDFAVRDWARRSPDVRKVLRQSDDQRLDALATMFSRHGYTPEDARIRARVLYYMQIGYTDADLQETTQERLDQVAQYIFAFTGKHASQGEMAQFRDTVLKLDQT